MIEDLLDVAPALYVGIIIAWFYLYAVAAKKDAHVSNQNH